MYAQIILEIFVFLVIFVAFTFSHQRGQDNIYSSGICIEYKDIECIMNAVEVKK